jgi:hypothetical protein
LVADPKLMSARLNVRPFGPVPDNYEIDTGQPWQRLDD